MGDVIRLKSRFDGFELPAYHVRPNDARRGGLVLVQEIFGVTDHIRDLCEGYAEDGYEVIAPAFYERLAPGFAASYEADDVARGVKLSEATPWDQVAGDLQAAVQLIEWYRARWEIELLFHIVKNGCRIEALQLSRIDRLERDGVIASYRKTHLWNEEKLFFSPGNLGFPVFPTRIGRIGLLVCWDIWFPETARIVAQQGADEEQREQHEATEQIAQRHGR